MFEIKKLPEKENRYHISFKGKFLAEAYYNEDKVLFTDDFPELDIDTIARTKLADLPDNFSLNMALKKPYLIFLDYLLICRKGKQVIVKLTGMLDINNDDLKWLYWNPLHFVQTARTFMKKNDIYNSENEKYYDEPPGLTFEFSFPAEGTVGAMMKKCEKQCREIVRETELYLLKKAEKKLNRK